MRTALNGPLTLLLVRQVKAAPTSFMALAGQIIADELGVSGGGEVTGGPTQNLALVHSGDMAFGLTTMGPASDAIKGESPLAPGLVMDNVCALFPMYETPFLSLRSQLRY